MAELEDLVGRLFLTVDQHGVGACFGVSCASPQRLVLAEPGDQRLGPGYYQRATGKPSGLDLALKLLDRHQYLSAAGAQTAVLREGFVLTTAATPAAA